MLNMFKSDLYRISKGKAIYVTFFVIVIMSLVSCIGMSAGHIGLSTGASNINMEDPQFVLELSRANSLKEVREVMTRKGAFPLDKDIISQNNNLYYMFIIIIVIVITTDFSNKTIKNTLSSAVSRKKYYFSKALLVLFLATIMILFNNYLSYFLNYWINGKEFTTSFLEFSKLTIIQLPLLYGIVSLLICFAFVFKKTSLFNTVSIPFIMITQLIVIIITNLFKLKANWFYEYEFQFALEKIVNHPNNKYLISIMILGCMYVLLFNVIGYYSFHKTEIK